jgi:urease accessory protein
VRAVVPELTTTARLRSGHGHGRGTVVARLNGQRSVLQRLYATSPLRFLQPTFAGTRAASACLVTFGGGLVDGDAIDVDLVVEPGATLVVFTQATTKVFKGSSRQSLRAEVHGTLVLLPDPVACYAGSRYRQRVDITLHDQGSAVVLDGFTSGRPAFGDRWAFDCLDLATTVRRDSTILVRDALLLDASDGPIAPRLDRFEALATLVAVGPRTAAVAASILAPSVITPDLVAAPSAMPWIGEGAALVRIAASSPAFALAEARARLRNLPDIDVVDPFVSRH